MYSQSPRPPRTVKEGQTVTLKVSKGTEIVNVEDVYGMTSEDATTRLQGQGLVVSITPQVDDNYPVGTVIRTEPEAGAEVAVGTQVRLIVSREEVDTTTTVPDLRGLTVEQAGYRPAEQDAHPGPADHRVQQRIPCGCDHQPKQGAGQRGQLELPRRRGRLAWA